MATIGLGYGTATSLRMSDSDARAYAHPEIRFQLRDSDGTWRHGLDVELVFQRHAPARDDGDQTRAKSGWAETYDRTWDTYSKSYAPHVKADYDGEYDAKRLAKILKLVDRARDASYGTKAARTGDTMVALAVGLRSLGVEVRAYNRYVEYKRAERQGA